MPRFQKRSQFTLYFTFPSYIRQSSVTKEGLTQISSLSSYLSVCTFRASTPQANFLSLIISLSCAKTILLLSGLFLPLISPSLRTYCPSLSSLPDPHFSFPVDPPGWFLPYSHPLIPSGFPFTDSRSNSLLWSLPLVRMGEGTRRRSVAFPNVALLWILPLLCLSKI